MQTEQTQNVKTNYWLEHNEIREQSQYSFSKSPYFTTRVKVNIFEESFNVESDLRIPVPGHTPVRKKDDIELFSQHSRTRLIKFFTQIKLSDYYKLNFVTLTWHHDSPGNNKDLKKFLDKFKKRLNYNFENMDWIWRFEMQKRGAPHLHFMFLCNKKMKGFSNVKLEQELRTIFFDLKKCTCPHCLKYGFDFIELATPQKAFAYISKYIAKTNEQYFRNYCGRKWGTKRHIPTHPIESITLRGYQFIYLKQLLRNFYRDNTGKRNYINDNIQSLSSWFLICSTSNLRNVLLDVLTTPIQLIFKSLKDEGYICEKEVLDIDNCISAFYLEDNKFNYNNTISTNRSAG